MRRRGAVVAIIVAVVLGAVATRACDDPGPDASPALDRGSSTSSTAPVADRENVDAGRRRVSIPDVAAPTAAPAAPSVATSDGQQTGTRTVVVRSVDVVVLDTDGRTLPDAEVVLFEDHPRSGYSYWRLEATARTDTAGRATLAVSGGVALQLRATHGDLTKRASVPWRTEAGRAEATLRLRRGVRAHGRVVDADTLMPIAGAEVSLFHAPWSQLVTTDRDGRYVSGPVHQDAMLHLAMSDSPNVFAPGYDYQSTTTSSHNGVQELRLTPTTQVTFRLISPDGRPRRGRTGYVKTREGHTGNLFETNADGNATVDVVLEPGAELEVRPKRGAFVLFPATPERARERDLGDVSLVRAGTVEGIVVDASGAPIYGARVRIRSVAGGYARDFDSTGSDGVFELEHVGPEEHVITVHRRGGGEELRVDGVRAGDRDVRLVLPTRDDY